MYHPLETEQQLLTALAQGDYRATRQVYQQNNKIITAWIRKNGGDENDAADIFQEAMVILYEKAQQEDFRLRCKIGTYLFAVSRHLWLKKLQQAQKQPVKLPGNTGLDNGLDFAWQEDVQAHEEREQYFELLNHALDQLGEPCRSLLKAFYHQEKSMQQIAAEFGYTNPDNAKTQKYKCLNRLRKIFYGVRAKW